VDELLLGHTKVRGGIPGVDRAAVTNDNDFMMTKDMLHITFVLLD